MFITVLDHEVEIVFIEAWNTKVSFQLEDKVMDIRLDPSVRLLFEEVQ